MFERILVTLDGSPLAEKSLPYAQSLAQQYDAHLSLGWVVPIPTANAAGLEAGAFIAPLVYDTLPDMERATAYLEAIQEQLNGHQISSSIRVVESHSLSAGIVELAAQEKADLIIKTTYARLGISRWLQGNVAAEVLQRASCPLFLIRVSDSDSEDAGEE